MSSLQGQATSRIDALVGRAYSEYQAKKATDESVNYAYFYNKYSSAAEELEGRTDKVFYQIVGVIENELKANNLAANHAQSFVTQYEKEKEKEARRSALLDKAMNR
jgi:carboxylesterase type B